MIVNRWIILDPKGDRPYTSSIPPVSLVRSPGMRVYRIEADEPEPVPVDGVLRWDEVGDLLSGYEKHERTGS